MTTETIQTIYTLIPHAEGKCSGCLNVTYEAGDDQIKIFCNQCGAIPAAQPAPGWISVMLADQDFLCLLQGIGEEPQWYKDAKCLDLLERNRLLKAALKLEIKAHMHRRLCGICDSRAMEMGDTKGCDAYREMVEAIKTDRKVNAWAYTEPAPPEPAQEPK